MSGRGYLSIGDVLSVLREEFPDVTISKIRFLESQGLVEPERSPSGYRKFYPRDVERLRWVLRQQREHFLPLKVIRDRLERDGEPTPASATMPADDAVVTSPSGGVTHDGEGERAEPALAMSGAAVASRPEGAAPGTPSGVAALGALPAPRSAGAGPRGHDNGDSGRAAVGGAPTRAGGADRPGALGGPRATSAAAARAFQELRAAAGAGTPVPDAPARDEPVAGRSEDASAAAGIGGAAGAGGPEGAMAPTGGGAPGDKAQPRGAQPLGTAEDAEPPPTHDAESTGAGAARGPAEASPKSADRLGGPGTPVGAGGRTAGAGGDAGPGAPHGGTGEASAEHAGSGHAGSEATGGGRSGERSSRGAGRSGATPAGDPAGRPPSLGSLATGASLSADELCAASGISAAELAGLERFGLLHSVLVAGLPCYDEDALTVARLAAQLAQFGVEPRHLRLFRNAVERELGLAEQVITPLLRQRNPEARQRAMDTAAELARLGEALRGALLREGLQGFFGRPG